MTCTDAFINSPFFIWLQCDSIYIFFVQFWFVKKIYILCPFIIVHLNANELSYQIKYRYLLTHLNRYRSILFVFFIYFEKTHLHLFGCKNVTMKSWWNVTAKYVSNTIMDIAENIFFDFELLHFFQNAQRSFQEIRVIFLEAKSIIHFVARWQYGFELINLPLGNPF